MAKAPTFPKIKVLVMCGGKGTRMWPISNLGHPKQFERLFGKKSMFRHTIERTLKGFAPGDIFIATSVQFAEFLKKQAAEIPAENFILEPAMRDNLGAIGLATAVIDYRYPDAVMIILWGADHIVQKEKEFLSALKQAAKLAYENQVIVHIDTPPTYPSVHNGWIKIGKKLFKSDKWDVFEFIRQVEKPDEETAEKFLKSHQYLIHVGYMATRPSLLLDYYRFYAPEAFKIVQKIRSTLGTDGFNRTLHFEYPKFEKISVDYGLFEKLPPRSQWEMPVDMGWIDVGTWELLYNGLPKDKNRNVVIGNVHLIDTRNSLIIGQKSNQLGVIGITDTIIVETESGLLVCPMNQAPKVKTLYNDLFEKKD